MTFVPTGKSVLEMASRISNDREYFRLSSELFEITVHARHKTNPQWDFVENSVSLFDHT